VYYIKAEFISGVIGCSVELERRIARLFHLLSEKVEDRRIKMLLRFVARESENHAETLLDIARTLSVEPMLSLTPKMCKRYIGVMGVEALNRYSELCNRLEGGWKPTIEEILRLIDDELMAYEGFVGEELIAEVLYKMLGEISHETKVEILLKEIKDDEKHHGRILGIVKELLRIELT